MRDALGVVPSLGVFAGALRQLRGEHVEVHVRLLLLLAVHAERPLAIFEHDALAVLGVHERDATL